MKEQWKGRDGEQVKEMERKGKTERWKERERRGGAERMKEKVCWREGTEEERRARAKERGTAMDGKRDGPQIKR